ncbi:hypothetical protein L9F63_019020, partial [Diploptera punctata]
RVLPAIESITFGAIREICNNEVRLGHDNFINIEKTLPKEMHVASKSKKPKIMTRKNVKIPVECSICKKKLRMKSEMERHTRSHTQEKPYRCEICNQHFAYNYTLKHHKITHTGERPYNCDICSRHSPIKIVYMCINKYTH